MRRCGRRAPRAGTSRAKSDTIDTPVGTTLDEIVNDAPGLGSKGPVVRIRVLPNECSARHEHERHRPRWRAADIPAPRWGHPGLLQRVQDRGRHAGGSSPPRATPFLNTGLFAFGSRVRARVAGNGQPTPVGGVYSIFDPRPSLYGKTLVFLADVDGGGTTQQAVFVAKLRR